MFEVRKPEEKQIVVEGEITNRRLIRAIETASQEKLPNSLERFN